MAGHAGHASKINSIAREFYSGIRADIQCHSEFLLQHLLMPWQVAAALLCGGTFFLLLCSVFEAGFAHLEKLQVYLHHIILPLLLGIDSPSNSVHNSMISLSSLRSVVVSKAKFAARRHFLASSRVAASNTGKTALVTGGSQGLGEAIARRLVKDGYIVTIADVKVETGQALAKEIGATFVQADVSQPDQVENAVEHVVQAHGTLDALVNSAGVVSSQVPYATIRRQRMAARH